MVVCRRLHYDGPRTQPEGRRHSPRPCAQLLNYAITQEECVEARRCGSLSCACKSRGAASSCATSATVAFACQLICMVDASRCAEYHDAGAEPREDRSVWQRDLVRSVPPVRGPAEPPQPIEVQHSSSYLYRRRQEEVCAYPAGRRPRLGSATDMALETCTYTLYCAAAPTCKAPYSSTTSGNWGACCGALGGGDCAE